MKWVAISGSWRKTNNQVEEDVKREIREIISRGDCIISGGALGVDYITTDEALKLDPSVEKIKIFIPATLELYAKHYRKRANERVITMKQAEELITQLTKLRNVNSNSLIEDEDTTIVDKDSYYKRNSKVIESADELIAFQVNKSLGVQDTIDKAKKKNIPIKLFQYEIS